MMEILSRSTHNQCFLGFYKVLTGVTIIIKFINSKILKNELSTHLEVLIFTFFFLNFQKQKRKC